MANVERARALAAARAKKYRDKNRLPYLVVPGPAGPVVWQLIIGEPGRPRYRTYCVCGEEITTVAQCVSEVRWCTLCKKRRRGGAVRVLDTQGPGEGVGPR